MGARGRGHIAELTALVPPDVSVVLNVGTAHLGEFGSREAIAEAKGELVDGARDRRHGRAQRRRRAGRRDGGARPGPGGDLRDGAGADVRVEDLALDRLGRPPSCSPPRGRARRWRCRWSAPTRRSTRPRPPRPRSPSGLAVEQVAAALGRVATLSKWRMELHELAGGVVVLNDAYNANPESMRAAIDALASIGADPAVRRTVAVLGVMRELGDDAEGSHREVGAYAAGRVDQLVVVGRGRARHPRRRPARAGPSVLVEDNAAAIAWLARAAARG